MLTLIYIIFFVWVYYNTSMLNQCLLGLVIVVCFIEVKCLPSTPIMNFNATYGTNNGTNSNFII